MKRAEWLWLVRVACLGVFAAGIGLLVHRLDRSPEQRDLTRYVEVELPRLTALEQPIDAEVARLGQAPGLKPEAARKLLVDELIPSILKLRKTAEELPTATGETRALSAGYVKVADRLLEACRASVRVIDDPKLSTKDGLARVRKGFADARAAREAWSADLEAACRRHHLTGPKR